MECIKRLDNGDDDLVKSRLILGGHGLYVVQNDILYRIVHKQGFRLLTVNPKTP